jgi:hypothetical protein
LIISPTNSNTNKKVKKNSNSDKKVSHIHDPNLIWVKKSNVDNSFDVYSGADVDANVILLFLPMILLSKSQKRKN